MNKKSPKSQEPEPSLKELILAYRCLKIDIEERESAFKKSVEEDKLALEILESELLAEMNARGLGSCKLKKAEDEPDYMQGTLYITTRLSARVEDVETFFDYVFRTGDKDLLVARAAEKSVKEFIAVHHEPPPGVVTSEVQRLGFRKS
jgi:hypothetical protein